MNDSGLAVAALARRYGVEPEQIVIVHDELDLPAAALRVKSGGGLAGHNGLRSITSHLHSDEFQRVRIGVGKPVSKERGVDHVLRRFSKRERAEIDVTIEQAADAVECIATDGVDAAMNRYQLTRSLRRRVPAPRALARLRALDSLRSLVPRVRRLAGARSCTWVARCEPGYPPRGRSLLHMGRSLLGRDTRLAGARSYTWVARCEPGYPPRGRSLLHMGRSLLGGIPASRPLAPTHGSLAASRDTRLAAARSCTWVARCEPGYPPRGRSLLASTRLASLARAACAVRSLVPRVLTDRF